MIGYKACLPPVFKESVVRMNPAKFVREVRSEAGKITWPSRKETMVSTGMVLVMVAIAATFFIVVDVTVNAVIRAILGL